MFCSRPKKRLESFFYDKLRKSVGLHQDCQKNLTAYVPKEKIAKGKVSFDDLVHSIKLGYNDRHVWSQSDTFVKVRTVANFVGQNTVTLLQLGEAHSMKVLEKILGNEIAKENATTSFREKEPIEWSKSALDFVKRQYADDFDLFEEFTKQKTSLKS